MNKKRLITISMVSLFIFVIMFVALQKGTFSAEEYKYSFENTEEVNLYKTDLQKLIGKTAKAFYYNRDYIKYKSGNMLGLTGIDYSYRDFTVSPEDLNVNKVVYMDEASFMFSVYINALGLDLSDGLVDSFDIEAGSTFVEDTLLKIIEIEDERLVLESDSLSIDDQTSFVTKYLNNLEIGDIIVYTLDDGFHLALYIGTDSENNPKCIYLYDGNDNSAIYMHDVDDYLFPNGSFLEDDSYYAIIRPINSLSFNSLDRVSLNVPVNSLARMDDVFVRRYTDVGTNNLYPGEVVNYTIEITNNSSQDVNIKTVSDIIPGYVGLINTTDGVYNDDSRTISWNDIVLKSMETRKFTYTVKVNGENEIGISFSKSSVYGKEIISDGANVIFNDESVLNLNKIKYMIANKYIQDQEDDLNSVLNKIDVINSYLDYDETNGDEYKNLISEITSDSKILLDGINFNNFVYYNAFGVDLGINGFTNYDNIKNSLFILNESGHYTVNSDALIGININSMVVGNLYGGAALNDNTKSKIISPIKAGNYTYSNLVSGDIIISWNLAGEAVSYLFVKNTVNDIEIVSLINFDENQGIQKFTNVDEILNNIITESNLYVVLRPSMILDIKLEDVQLEPINLMVDGEKKIEFSKRPLNATINSINYSESNKFVVDSNTGIIKGIATGTDMLTITFNGNLSKEVQVVVSKEIYDFSIVTEYGVDNENDILYVGNDREVTKILEKISFNTDGYEKRIVDSSYQEISGTITETAILEVSMNSQLVEQYKIVYFSLNSDDNIRILTDEKIFKYVTVGTTINDLLNSIKFNDSSVGVEFYGSDNVKLNSDDNLSTGDYLLFNVTDKLQDQYQISVVGDISGNGIFNGNDIVLTRRHIVGWQNPQTGEIYELTGVYAYAMDFTMNGIVNGNDVSAMRRKLVN